MTIFNTLKRRWHSFAKDNRGVAAIEFALGAPVLVITLLVFSAGLEMDHKSASVGKVSATIADILSQSPVTNKAAMDTATNAGLALVGSEAAENLEILITGVYIENQGTSENPDYRGIVEWNYRRNPQELVPPGIGSVSDKIPQGLLQKEGYVVIARARLNATATFMNEALGYETAAYDYENFFIPRSSIKTECEDCDQ